MVSTRSDNVHRSSRLLVAALVAASCRTVTAAVNATTELPANQALIAGDVSAFKVTGTSAADAKATAVSASSLPGGNKALHIEVRKRAASDYEIQYVVPVGGEGLKKGDTIWASVWARMIKTSDESGQGILGMVVEQDKAPFNKLVQRRVSVGAEWQQLAAPAKLNSDAVSGTLHLAFRVGGAAQTLELANPQLVRFNDPGSITLDSLPQTRLTYVGRDPNASWRKAADERIEQIRKAPLTVHLTDAAGKPVANAAITVAMTQHAFPFGSCYNISNINGDGANTPNGKKYRDLFAELFNVGVDEYAMKWGFWENATRRVQTLDALKWMDDHGIRVRGHCLVWPAFKRNPEDLKQYQNDPAGLAKRIDARITDTAGALKGRVTEWDVINEPYANKDFMNLLGDKAMAHWFKLAHEADPNVPLFLNETSVPTAPPKDQHYDVLYNQVKMIQAEGGPIGGVGMQAHFGTNLTDIKDLQTIYDRFATLGVPLQITELDIDVTDEQLQADYLRDLMTITFAHPNSYGIMMWGFWAGQHWRPDAALYKKDWTIKPSGQAWIDLVKKKWWTNADLTSSADGSASVRGFLGDYTVTVKAGERTQTVKAKLAKGGTTLEVVLK